ncbi:hypothetical protein ACIGC1_10430 [Peribacillus butanolivorans]
MKPIVTSLLGNALMEVMSFDVKPHEMGCTVEELDVACNIFVIESE